MTPQQIHQIQQDRANRSGQSWRWFGDFAAASFHVNDNDTSLDQVLDRLKKNIKQKVLALQMPDGSVEEHVALPNDSDETRLIKSLMHDPKAYLEAFEWIQGNEHDALSYSGKSEMHLYKLYSLVHNADHSNMEV